MNRIELSKHKILNYPDRIQSLVETNDAFPVTTEIDPINLCNHRCVWCADHKFKRTGDFIPYEAIDYILEQVKSLGSKSIIFKGGGEPTLHPRLADFILLAKKKDFKVAMLSNGELITSQLAKVIVDSMEYVRISLDAVDKESHNKWHRSANKNAFDKILKNIKMLVNNKLATQSKILIGVNVLYDNNTYHNIGKAYRLISDLGIDILSFRKAFTTPYGFKSNWTKEQESDCSEYIMDIKKRVNGNISIMWDASRGEEIKHNSEEDLKYCYATPLILIICANMKIYPCCDLRWIEEYCYGDLKESSLQDIWNSKRRKEVLNNKVIPKHCAKDCTHRFAYFNDMLNYLKSDYKPHMELL
jgi:MoaA/NifB/PqqE/SkfB family radical SAM enzyme